MGNYTEGFLYLMKILRNIFFIFTEKQTRRTNLNNNILNLTKLTQHLSDKKIADMEKVTSMQALLANNF